MKKNYFNVPLLLFYFNFCYSQSLILTDTWENILNLNLSNKNIDKNTGRVYFSKDKGKTWKDVSSGIPQNVTIGLGSLAVSGKSLVSRPKIG